MKKTKKGWSTVFILMTLTALLLAVWVYIGQLSHATESSVVAFMEELSRHDMQNIQGELNSSWNELSAVYARTQASGCSSIQEVCSRMNIEQTSKTFDEIYLVDANGNTYSSVYGVQDISDKGYILPMFSNRQKYVMRYDSWEIPEAARENLVYGVRCSPFKAGNIEFIGIVGISQIDMIEKRLKVDSFGGRGYVGIIDIDGNYVVSRERSAGIGKADNYFDQLRMNTALSENEINDIINRLTQGEAFIEHIDYNNQVDQVVSFINMPETTWSIVLTVPQDVFSEQTQQFVVMTGIMLGVVVVVLCLMMLVIIRISVVSRTAKAEAKSRGDFLSSMSHEIRTPLNGIIGLNHLMQENTQNPEKLEEYLTKSDSTAKYLLSLVNDILDMSKLQAGKMELVPRVFSIPCQISTIESIMRSPMEDKNISFQIETEILWSDIIGDETRIEQILMNILGNAVKFTQKDGSITMRVFQVREESSRVITVYEIEDTGCGMSEEFQKIIFDSFSQEHNNVSRGTHGTGLGMAISFLLAKQMDGTLSVQSKLGIGSCFTFRLPAEIADGVRDTNRKNYAVPEAVDIVQETAPEREKVKILVAEDNELNAEILLEILKNAGFSAVRANDGGQAVDIFEASSLHEFGIILMDVQMPVLNGYEATKVIRAMNRSDAKTVIIYACTANTFKDDQVKALESGMNGFIAKPIDVDKLMQKLG